MVQGDRSKKGRRYSIFSYVALKWMGSEADNLALLDFAVIYQPCRKKPSVEELKQRRNYYRNIFRKKNQK